MSGMFQAASIFNQDISGWNVSSVTEMSAMFQEARAFNQDISGWDVSSVMNMVSMFSNATAFDQNIGAWNVSSARNMSSMFLNKTLSIANYDALLAGWSALTLQSGVPFSAGNSQYSDATSRGILTGATNSWVITDGGLAP